MYISVHYTIMYLYLFLHYFVGDLVLLASGSAVPADCVVNHGSIEVDQAALTGESLPVTMHQGNDRYLLSELGC